MKAFRVVLAVLLLGAAIAVIERAMVPLVRCNLAKGAINRTVRRFHRIGDEYQRFNMARRNLVRCDECLAAFPNDYQMHLLRAANLRILGRYDEAVRTFEHALTLTERAEIYAQLGEVEIERGNVEAARRALLKAATFNIEHVMTVDQPMRDEIYTAVYARIDRLKAAKHGQASPSQ
ncbi:MAG TPA: hypothetical protein VEK79_13570 [Thermoanaerobaculia bacterium]|nr:hypothetical protein [Thermoanaerobaculia bacterium]